MLYVASSDGGPDKRGGSHHLSAFRAGGDGTLELVNRVPLPSRPIHCCVDPAGGYVFTAHNLPSTLSVHRLDSDAIGAASPRPRTSTAAFTLIRSESRTTGPCCS